jgi:signal transduction histidine kinase
MLKRIFGWRRVVLVLSIATVWGFVISPAFTTPVYGIIGREYVIGLAALLAFGLFERFPRTLPRWFARWALQVMAIAIAIFITVPIMYVALTPRGATPFYKDEKRLHGFGIMMMTSLLIGPWVAVAALFRQRDDAARHQALAFELERSQLERKALDARLRLLQAQVEPHFLFNTLANVRELVDSGAPQASKVLDSLIAYLRAAVPRLQQNATTLGEELELVRAYLELMHMRMPDRMQFEIHAEPAALAVQCPPMALLTLVENAIRHGIDPSEVGGRVDIRAHVREGRCRVEVSDTGVGLQGPTEGLGTGLGTLRERLELVFAGDAQVRLVPLTPHGVRAEMEFPAKAAV